MTSFLCCFPSFSWQWKTFMFLMDLPSADVCIEETRNDPRVLCLQACLYLHGEGKANFFTAILLTAVLIIFLAAYSQWSEKFIPWPCQSWKGQISFIFLLTPLFHLLQAALCLSITRLHCFLMRCLWPFASPFPKASIPTGSVLDTLALQ